MTISATPSQTKRSSFAPTVMSVDTPREASAFITTTAQSPFFTCQTMLCRPVPLADSAHIVCAAGLAGDDAPC